MIVKLLLNKTDPHNVAEILLKVSLKL
jgi:hypothetical protein